MIRRTYACDGCDLEWAVSHDSGDEPIPPCPVCEAKSRWQPKPLRIKTNKSRAMDLAQKTAEDMGMSNMKDNTRVGESVAMTPRDPSTSDNEAVMRQSVTAMRELANRGAGNVSPQMREFLGATGNTLNDPTAPLQAPTQLIGIPGTPSGPNNAVPLVQSPAYQAAKVATDQARQMNGESPTGMLHKAMKHEKRSGDPRVPVSGARMLSQWRP